MIHNQENENKLKRRIFGMIHNQENENKLQRRIFKTKKSHNEIKHYQKNLRNPALMNKNHIGTP